MTREGEGERGTIYCLVCGCPGGAGKRKHAACDHRSARIRFQSRESPPAYESKGIQRLSLLYLSFWACLCASKHLEVC
ncbi:hypothetical protein P175DRAFT_0338727 [Aspergillus ochraceoroseus IBT 24754]|uniref:Uncharacterized protein n=1 Tax=Aspergillus ochraceoroseus IBT 24754 TaxID=1392256 RepID=A0A2T5LRL3_9EURO|nr:uncharacterized protein P175DRAFT_0338727 [Aspergillus ochraceoroseus IBT 24754]PTU18917.1 hypothetical protein P175DRAFT_0338727 [Aspergillus ochraceoroseus IBT 24754]